ncbi:hypothetical protein [Mycetohabitans sp. B46]|uniref:hypothetical protein n=1 Tax=Mycetohabitans sp. B46 TaxID=2772536 RepID=UPI00307EE040
MAERIVGNFIVRTMQSSTRPGEWTSTYFISRLDAKLREGWVVRQAIDAVFDNQNAAAEYALDAGVKAAARLAPDARGASRERG